MKYSINYEKMFDALMAGGSYTVEAEHKAIAIQAIKAKWGFEPEWEYSPDRSWVTLSL